MYFGTDYNDVNDANTTNGIGDPNVYKENIFVTSWDPATDLEKNKTYYWRIDEVNVPVGNKYNKGEVWSFTTADMIIVDDMELYGNSPDPCDIWKDGNGQMGNRTGSAVFLEKGEFVNSGLQSMKYTYDNDGITWAGGQYVFWPNCYSEIEADTNGPNSLDCGLDWTRDDSKALRLYFYGDPNNDVVGDANVMYVVIEDGDGNDANAIIKYGSYNTDEEDVNDLKDESWHEWNIALDDFNTPNNVNLANIAKVYIGFGRRGEPTHDYSTTFGRFGGHGTVYFDDIRLYQSGCIAMYNSDVDLNNDCDIDYDDIDVLQNVWLDVNTVAINPGDSNLVAHYEFEDDPCDSVDVDPNLDGIEYGTPYYPDGNIGKCIFFNGQDEFVVVDDANGAIAAEFSTESFSVSLWMKSTVLGVKTDEHIFCNGTDGGHWWGSIDPNVQSGKYYRLFFPSSAAIQFKIDDGSDPTGEAMTASSLVDTGEWVHLAAVCDRSDNNVRLYVDSVLRGIDDVEDVNSISSPNEPLVFGARVDDVDNATGLYTCEGLYNGHLDDVRIYNKALTSNEVIFLAGGSPTPDDMKHNADLNLDNFVDLKDYAVLADAWLDDYRWP